MCGHSGDCVTVVSISAEQPGPGPGTSMQRCGAGPGSAVQCSVHHTGHTERRVLQTGTEEENNV